MDIVIIAGFLGAGKTSLLLHLARRLTAEGRRVAVIENEVGKVGVDGPLLQAEGLTVRELYAGCVCCSLRFDLVQTLLELERAWRPDIVMIEPSGVAGPDLVLEALTGYGGDIGRKLPVVVLDATRAELAIQDRVPLLRRGVEAAELLVLSKTDAVAAEETNRLAHWVRTVRPALRVQRVSTLAGTGLEALEADVRAHLSPAMAAAAAPCPTDRHEPAHTHSHSHAHTQARTDAHAATFAWRRRLTWPAPVASSAVQAGMSALLQRLAEGLATPEAPLPGHLKAIFTTRPQGGYLLLSTTSVTTPPETRGRLPPLVTEGDFTLNAILFGASTARVAQLFDEILPTTGLVARTAEATELPSTFCGSIFGNLRFDGVSPAYKPQIDE
ncbi:MAG: GTP-binding protein [Kiritimatiellae bacterium]|nr:GTP-binding protein [Kiritimatiellia bacterium]